jgi:hypothetical protein
MEAILSRFDVAHGYQLTVREADNRNIILIDFGGIGATT